MAVTTVLAGKRVVVTRAAEQAEDLCRLIEDEGGDVIRFPTIAFTPLDPPHAGEILERLDAFGWFVFTSANGVRFFQGLVDKRGALVPANVPVATVGPATADAARAAGFEVRAMPSDFQSNQIPAVLGDVKGVRVLLARGAKADPALIKALETAGADVTELQVYDTGPPSVQPDQLAWTSEVVDAVTFTSPSTLNNFLNLVPGAAALLKQVRVVCIGPVTARAAQAAGLHVSAVAAEHTVSGLVAAVAQSFEGDA